MNQVDDRYRVRQATTADLSVLAAIKSPLALHRDRLRDANGQSLLYLVVISSVEVVGFGLLVFDWPTTWPDPGLHLLLPTMIDLFVRPTHRSRGAGSHLIHWMEDAAQARGLAQMYVAVDPVANPRAHQFYLRLGYHPLQEAPYRSHWQFTDSDGQVHGGEDWQIDLCKSLRQPT